MEQIRKVGILLFNDVEVLDFCGPFEVFSVVNVAANTNFFQVFTIAEKAGPVLARNQLSINPHYTFKDCPDPDILLVPGGLGTRKEIHNPVLMDWIKDRSQKAELVLSVCTGSLLLARAGLLDGLTATTHYMAIELLKENAPRTMIDSSKRFIDNGRVIVSAGISAGIDMSLYVVARLLGEEKAIATAQYMEYRWEPEGL